jgi:uncharacterized protein (TIGR02145 family)
VNRERFAAEETWNLNYSLLQWEGVMRRVYLAMLMAAAGFLFVGPAAAQTGTFVDSRDKQTYKTVTIGKQTWMAQNLNYQTDSSWCYENNANNCKKYGRLYDWNMAKLVCPKDWHLPSKKEWREMVALAGSSTGGTKLKSKNGWKEGGNGTDDYGFSALPGGRRGSDGKFRGAGYGYWWTATDYPSGGGNAYYRNMDYNYGNVYEDYRDKSNGYSIRCVKE